MKYDWPAELSAKDIREMIGLMNAVAVREMTLGFTEPLNDEDGFALMRAFDAELRRGALELLAVRTDDGTIVGMVTLARAPLPARRHVVDLRRCVIDPEHRGKFLLEGFEETIRKVAEMGCDVITLEVRDDGPRVLWHRLGFQEYGRLPDYARKAGQAVTGHFMYARRADLEAHFRQTGTWLHELPAPSAAG
ncbi:MULTISPECIES: GNAT family N-acetyltransferase [unclassified Solwaraspora]|uniref:GNAT family N-acetyltransferase n=1 Tax=unclassified Solwaraspora TaxID=2627926 RepID=UPI00248C2B5D|nr:MULTISPECIES: GNAT family N-acetyltransferase [unclassified Solwaraspora]WBB96665.1 GNAT family N-acetyltransferase [Solwaraspora sp. WMMA2059]WBC19431.1 GNAT family N-acetyltransferase [Solwaraspora sp. WMMA2080]WJK32986.1 GNAT family N-acetyltransferase [Solwaraspora sp. WMMA2065]